MANPVQVPTPELVETSPCFSIYDNKAVRFGAPQSAPTEDVAVRQFSDLCSAPGSVYHRHPADFELFYCGDWDWLKGEFIKQPKRFIINGTSVVVEDQNA